MTEEPKGELTLAEVVEKVKKSPGYLRLRLSIVTQLLAGTGALIDEDEHYAFARADELLRLSGYTEAIAKQCMEDAKEQAKMLEGLLRSFNRDCELAGMPTKGQPS